MVTRTAKPTSTLEAAYAKKRPVLRRVRRELRSTLVEDRHAYLTYQHAEQRVRIVQAGARLAAIFEAIWP